MTQPKKAQQSQQRQEVKDTPKTYSKQDAALPTVTLKGPHGQTVTVPRRRAEQLLARQPLELPGGKTGEWSEVSKDDDDSEG